MLVKKNPLNEKVRFHKNPAVETFDFQIMRNDYLKDLFFVVHFTAAVDPGVINYIKKCILKCGGKVKTYSEYYAENWNHTGRFPRDMEGKVMFECNYFFTDLSVVSIETVPYMHVWQYSKNIRLRFSRYYLFPSTPYNDPHKQRVRFNEVFEEILQEHLKLDFLEKL